MAEGKVVTASPTDETFEWGQQALFAAFGQGTPREGMIYAGVLFVIVFSWTAIGLVFTAILDVIFGILFLYNFGRAIVGWIRRRRS
jgi:hypothetical protein